MGKLTFEDELKEFNQNRSKYPRIKPDLDLRQWSRYDFNRGKTFHQSLQEAASVKICKATTKQQGANT